ncbi:MAG: hypothetical protein JWP49_273 [Phenylobacterium sp.]|nr:hypothetical protein [Phenylobacterium sp.]
MSILSIFLLFQLAYLSMGNFIQMQAKVSFDTRLTALAPYISDAEYKMLAARWVLIDGRADYEALMGQMQSDADIHHVRLPPRLL